MITDEILCSFSNKVCYEVRFQHWPGTGSRARLKSQPHIVRESHILRIMLPLQPTPGNHEGRLYS